MTRQNKIQAVIDHINATRPCTLSGVVAWCKSQGLVSVLPEALRIMVQAGELDYDTEDSALGTVLQ